jgi:D-psicose/D-tagatose/L-ribulose 3-epimerase
MRINRRHFVAGSLAFGAAGQALLKAAPKPFKYAFCNESMQGMPWPDQCKLIANAGYQGVEIAPFSLVQNDVSELTAGDRRSMVTAMQDAGIECAGLHWLLAPPPPGLHATTGDRAVRDRTWAYFRQLIDFCGDLGGTVMVFGSPKQRNTQGIPVAAAVRHLTEGLAAVADQARERGVRILVEPLDHTQTDVVNTMAEARKVLGEIKHPAVSTMFDFHNTLDEKEPFHVLVEKHFDAIGHIHVQEMDGQYLGAGSGVRDFLPAFQALKRLKYNGWVSVEVFDFEPGPLKLANESMKALKELEKAS